MFFLDFFEKKAVKRLFRKKLLSGDSTQAILFRRRLWVGLTPILATYLVALFSLNIHSNLFFSRKQKAAVKSPSKKITPFLPAPRPLYFSKNIIVKAGSTIAHILTENRIDQKDRKAVIKALKKYVNVRDIKTGMQFTIHYTPENNGQNVRLNTFLMNKDFDKDVIVERQENGDFKSKLVVHPTKRLYQVIRGRIDTCFYQDARKQGLTSPLLHKIVQVLGYKFDLQRDLHPGDTFCILFEKRVNQKTGIEKQDKCLLVEVVLRGKKTRIYYFKRPRHADIDFFDEKGNGLKSYFLRTPVDGARLTSGFGIRKHPILGYTKMHRGVDFGARRGTPVMAAGDGTVVSIGRRGSYGNYIRIRHISGYATAYAHLNGFKKGLRRGARVKQGHVIGYVGATGRATGPHLHFELLKNGRQINPKSVKMLPRVKLAGKDFKLFQTHVQKMHALYEKDHSVPS